MDEQQRDVEIEYADTEPDEHDADDRPDTTTEPDTTEPDADAAPSG